jgi:hypothetical protein
MPDIDPAQNAVQQFDEAAWQLAALVLVLDDGASSAAVRQAAAEVVKAAGLDEAVRAVDPALRTPLAGQARSPLLQTAALVSGRIDQWAQQPDEALLAQGRASGQGAAAFARFALPRLGDLGERLARPGARMLDVGTGVGALAVAYAEQFPELTVVGIDVLPRVLALAERTRASSPAGVRVELREQSVADLPDVEAFDLAWIPAPFIPPQAFTAGLPRVAASMRPGGWIMLGHGRLGENPRADAVTRFKTVAYGGTPLTPDEAARMLGELGCTQVVAAPTPPGSPAVTLGRLP